MDARYWKHDFLWALIGAVCCLAVHGAAVAETPLVGTLPTLDPRPVGLGGVLRASPSGTAGIYLNPAVIAMTPIYHIELMYQYMGDDQMHTGGMAIVDSVTAMIAAGLSFNYSGIREPHTEHDAFDGRLSLAGGFGNVFFIGATGRYLHLDNNTRSEMWGPAGVAALPASGSQQVDGFTFDVGAALTLGKVVTLGLVGYNLTNTGSRYAPLELGGGISLQLLEMLLVEVNGVADVSSHDKTGFDLHLGSELFLARRFALRAGYIYDVYFNIHSISAGLGYVDSQFALDFGFMKQAVDDGRLVIALGFKYFVN
ncbi:MAG: hypothetical protein QNJ97_11845 [Myxococcota bacterium]|nr:hypothetical protein [Myxococcota bacterium]